jgi:hypothetical protein
LITTDEIGAALGKTVERVGNIGFFEVTQGGSVAVGDPIFINEEKIGKIAGFDETHFPNHYNIVVLTSKRISGLEVGFHIGSKLTIGTGN